MSTQYSTTARTNRATQLITDIGVSALIRIYTGSPPANLATAASGTLLDTLTGNATAFGSAAAGALTGFGTTTAAAASGANPIGPVNAVAAGIAGYFRIVKSDGTTEVAQGVIAQSVVIATSALTAANGNVLTFAATTGVSAGMNVSGPGVAAGCTVSAVSGTTVTMSTTSTAGVASAASITFNGDLTLSNTNINTGQAVSVTSLVLTMAGA